MTTRQTRRCTLMGCIKRSFIHWYSAVSVSVGSTVGRYVMGDTRFRLKRHYSIVAHSPDAVELRYGVWNPVSFTLTDSTESGHLFNIVTGLDGSRSSAELAAKEQVPIEEVEGVLDQLVQLGVVESEAANCLDHYLDDIVPGLAGMAGQRDEMRGVRLLGDPGMCEQVGTYIKP